MIIKSVCRGGTKIKIRNSSLENYELKSSECSNTKAVVLTWIAASSGGVTPLHSLHSSKWLKQQSWTFPRGKSGPKGMDFCTGLSYLRSGPTTAPGHQTDVHIWMGHV